MKVNLTKDDVVHVSKLASLKLSEVQVTKFQKSLQNVIDYMSKIQNLDTNNIDETTNVTDLSNITRDDVVDEARMLTQEEALSNAKASHDGYFLVPAILEE